MPNGGKITIQTCEPALRPPTVRSAPPRRFRRQLPSWSTSAIPARRHAGPTWSRGALFRAVLPRRRNRQGQRSRAVAGPTASSSRPARLCPEIESEMAGFGTDGTPLSLRASRAPGWRAPSAFAAAPAEARGPTSRPWWSRDDGPTLARPPRFVGIASARQLGYRVADRGPTGPPEASGTLLSARTPPFDLMFHRSRMQRAPRRPSFGAARAASYARALAVVLTLGHIPGPPGRAARLERLGDDGRLPCEAYKPTSCPRPPSATVARKPKLFVGPTEPHAPLFGVRTISPSGKFDRAGKPAGHPGQGPRPRIHRGPSTTPFRHRVEAP